MNMIRDGRFIIRLPHLEMSRDYQLLLRQKLGRAREYITAIWQFPKIKEISIKTPIYYIPYFWDPKKVFLILGNPDLV